MVCALEMLLVCTVLTEKEEITPCNMSGNTGKDRVEGDICVRSSMYRGFLRWAGLG